MNRIYKKTLAIAGIMIIMLTMTASAQEDELPDPGITPDSPLYGLDKAMESIQSVFISGNEEKARNGLKIAEERLAEAKAMADKGNYELSEEMSNEYENQIDKSIELGNSTSDSEQKENIQGIVANATTRHQLVLERVVDQVPEPAKRAINSSLNASMKGREKSLTNLGDTNPAKAAKVRFDFADNRINSTKENLGDEYKVRERVDEYTREINKTQELIEDAKQKGMNVTEFEGKVANDTSRHLTVLKEVHDRVPEHAKESISHAMNVSARGQKMALENMKNNNPGMVEEIEKNIPDFAKGKNTTENDSMVASPDRGKNINDTNNDSDSQQNNREENESTRK